MPDVKRLFMYHGAEHKTINAFEAGAELTPESVAKFSREHPRCGTAFLLTLVLLSIVVFALLGPLPIFWRLVTRILFIPILAGIALEYIRWTANHLNNPIVRLLIKTESGFAIADYARAGFVHTGSGDSFISNHATSRTGNNSLNQKPPMGGFIVYELFFILPHSILCSSLCLLRFNTYAGQEDSIPAYVDALCKEVELVGRRFPQGNKVHTVFFGGGTPSLLSPNQFESIFHSIRKQFDLTEDAEITIEANPGL